MPKKKKKRKPRKKAAKKSRRSRKRKTKAQRKQSSKSKKKRTKKKKHNFPKNPEKGIRKTISVRKRGGGTRKVTFEATGKTGFGAWRIVSSK